LRASRTACAFFVACETLPILAEGTRVRRRWLGSARMPSAGVSPAGTDQPLAPVGYGEIEGR